MTEQPEPTLGFIVSDAALWPALCSDRDRYQQARDWLIANDLSPSDIPAMSTISIEPGLGDGEFIHCTVYVRNERGHILVSPDGSSPVTEPRVVPMLVPLPWRAALPAPSPSVVDSIIATAWPERLPGWDA